MKLSAFLFLNWLLLAWNGNDLAPKEVLITGKVNVATIKEVSYTIPHRGVFHWGVRESSSVDVQGNFQIKIPCEQTSTVTIGGADQTKKTFIVSPGDHLTLNLGSEKNEDFFLSSFCFVVNDIVFRFFIKNFFIKAKKKRSKNRSSEKK